MKFEKLVINLDEDHSVEETVEEVLRLIREGYTSGYYPTWNLVKPNNEEQ
ncbi:MAG: hypothetical protein Q8O10_10270 [candidate division Zixibacteria bacterium]|nr:hypothetical protein [candidate division Zixibacteria bacterium]